MARIPIGNVYPSDEYLLARCAPTGFGLGRDAIYTADFNKALANGWYYGTLGTVNAPNGFTVNCTCFVVARTANQITQYFFDPTNGCELHRFTVDGGSTWEEDWVNPPMLVNVEYRTTERWNNLPVYKKLVCVDGMPSASQKVFEHGIANIVYVLGKSGVAVNTSTNKGFPFPCDSADSGRVDLFADPNKIVITTTKEMANTTGYVTLKYAKG